MTPAPKTVVIEIPTATTRALRQEFYNTTRVDMAKHPEGVAAVIFDATKHVTKPSPEELDVLGRLIMAARNQKARVYLAGAWSTFLQAFRASKLDRLVSIETNLGDALGKERIA